MPPDAHPPQSDSRLEALFQQILEALRQPRTTITVGNISGSSGIAIGAGASALSVSAADVSALRTLAVHGDARRKEEVYLTRFILGQNYARWERDYLPLAGHLQPALRYHNRNDPSLGAGGLPLDDVRDAIHRHRQERFIILGEPGAGKTTLLNRLALDLARERLRDPERGKLPISLSLANFRKARELPADFLREQWANTGLGQSYGDVIAYGQACFLLDGLNQMPADDRDERIDAWRRWANSESDLPPGNLAIFTCRVADYVPRLQLPEVHVQQLDNDRIRTYFEVRFGPEPGQRHWRTLRDRLRTGDERFEDLARNPMLLSLLADRVEKGKSLADSKGAILEDAALDRLAYEIESDNQPAAYRARFTATFEAALDALSRIAYDVQALGEGTAFDEARLEAAPPTGALTPAQVKDLALDATLLRAARPESRSGPYEFQHQLFQEYFAARELLRRFRASDDVSGLWAVDWQAPDLQPGDEQMAPPPATRWDETVTMAGGLAGKDTARFIAAVRDSHPPLAARALAEARPDEAPELKTLADDLRAELLTRQRDTSARLRARIASGLALGELGHPDLRPRPFEFEGRKVWAIVPPLEPVAAGEFIRGSAPDDPEAFPDEHTTERVLTLPAYRMARYPVTNAEYRFFIEDDGYENDRWWSEAGLKWKAGGPDVHDAALEQFLATRKLLRSVPDWAKQLERAGRLKAEIDYWKEMVELAEDEARERGRRQFSRAFDRPAFWEDTTLNSPARPVVGVNWHEAEAYARWLSAVSGGDHRLPAEMQWEKAARGSDDRAYPWEGDFDSARCNTVESRIFTTTPVGLYPDGRSPFGLFDAAGNVWEWTADRYQAYPGGQHLEDDDKDFKVVRGGSWTLNRRIARCASRLGLVPVLFYLNLGFRLCSPGL